MLRLLIGSLVLPLFPGKRASSPRIRMGVYSYSVEHVSPVPPARLYKALMLDLGNLLPKLMPLAVKSIEGTGDGGPGSFKKLNFAEGGKLRSVRSRIDEVDEKNCWHKYTVVEGDALADKLQKNTTYEAKIEPTPEGGSKYKMTVTYYTKGDIVLSEEDTRPAKEKALAVFRVVEGYLLQDPDAYA